MITLWLDTDLTLKALRETLCVAQAALPIAYNEAPPGETDEAAIQRLQRQLRHSECLGTLIREIDRQRPLGPDGTHGDRHTTRCGCDVSVSESTGHVWPCTRYYVGTPVTEKCTCWKDREKLNATITELGETTLHSVSNWQELARRYPHPEFLRYIASLNHSTLDTAIVSILWISWQNGLATTQESST